LFQFNNNLLPINIKVFLPKYEKNISKSDSAYLNTPELKILKSFSDYFKYSMTDYIFLFIVSLSKK